MSNIIKICFQPYSPAFQHAIHFALDKEGGLRPDMVMSMTRKDRGGETKAGNQQARLYPTKTLISRT